MAFVSGILINEFVTARLIDKSRNHPANSTLMEVEEHPIGLHARVDQFELIGIEKMGNDPCMLIHDLGPEVAHFFLVKFRLISRHLLQPVRPAFGLMAGVIEEQGPNQTSQRAGCLGFAEPLVVMYEGLDFFQHSRSESF